MLKRIPVSVLRPSFSSCVVHLSLTFSKDFGRPARAGGGVPRPISLPPAGGETKRGGRKYSALRPGSWLSFQRRPTLLILSLRAKCGSLPQRSCHCERSAAVSNMKENQLYSTFVLFTIHRIPIPLPKYNLSNHESPKMSLRTRRVTGNRCAAERSPPMGATPRSLRSSSLGVPFRGSALYRVINHYCVNSGICRMR